MNVQDNLGYYLHIGTYHPIIDVMYYDFHNKGSEYVQVIVEFYNVRTKQKELLTTDNNEFTRKSVSKEAMRTQHPEYLI